MKPSSPLPDLNALKKATDLAALVQSRGVKLKRQGADMVGLCPFHEEKTPSFRVTPSKNLFHCFGCGAAGSVIDFILKKDGLTKQQAIDWLVRQSNGHIARADPTPVASALPTVTVKTAALLKRVVGFYAKTLTQDREGFEYLKSRNLVDPTMLEIFAVGYCNGTLHKALPKGGEIIEGLKALGILNQRGEEVFRGRITVPIFDVSGNVSGLYARASRLCEKSECHRYLPGPHRGVFNGVCAKSSQTLFVAESILDAMALWQAGFRNVIGLYGTEGFTEDHETLIRENGTIEIYLCLDHDEAGRRATLQLKEKLSALVKKVYVIQWPEGVKDAADFFLSRFASDFEVLIRAANPTEAGKSDTTPRSEVTARLGQEEITMSSDGFIAGYGPRRYELRAIERASAARLRATIKAHAAEPGRFHIDTVDFYLSRSRRVFVIEAARLFRETPEVIEMDLNRLTVQLESYATKCLEAKSPSVALVSEGEKLEAQKLGRNPDLIAEILRDMERLGIVGEKINALAGYLAMTSRKMDDPLAFMILSGSGSGKSHLQDAILSLCPEEDLIKLTSLSDRALFYKGEDSLKHKVLAVEEEAGASGAHYAIRNLISSKKLVIETTIKNPLTGKMETQVNRVNGPTAVFQTTTSPEADAETRSRFIITSVDESPEQTRGILASQYTSHTLDGLLRKKQRASVMARHHSFQRLLRPISIVNPFEPLLAHEEDRLLMRRENPKYLHLILVVAFLRQMQRPVKAHPELGEYIEATLDDIATANDIALELFGSSLDELSRPSRELLRLTSEMVAVMAREQKCETTAVAFTRRDVREFSRWSDYQVKAHIRQLEELEYLVPTSGRRGQSFSYRLAWNGREPRFAPGLISVEEVQKRAKVVGLKTQLGGRKTNLEGPSRAQVGSNGNGVNTVTNGSYEVKNPKLAIFAPLPIPVLHENAHHGVRVVVSAEGGR